MPQSYKVFKFGGASIKDAEHIKKVTDILHNNRHQKLLIVVSAMGKTTDLLESLVAAHAAGNGRALEILESVKQYHYGVMHQLFGDAAGVYDAVNDTFVEIEWVLEEEPHDNYDYMYDQIVSVGEVLSSKIIGAYLNTRDLPTQWLDARDLILTDDLFRESWVRWPETEERVKEHVIPVLESGKMAITQGFIGSTDENFTTTLGREGSDYSAAIFSYCLDAESMTIWKDLPGVLTADPRYFKNAVRLDRLSFREAIQMTYYGAKVIHLKTVRPLQKKHVPLYVKSFKEPDNPGTLISGEVHENYPPIIAIERNQALLRIGTRDYSFIAEHHLSDIFSTIASLRLQVNLMQNTADGFAVCVNDIDKKVDQFIEKLSSDFEIIPDRQLELIAVRHYSPELLTQLKHGRAVLAEEMLPDTAQIVVRAS